MKMRTTFFEADGKVGVDREIYVNHRWVLLTRQYVDSVTQVMPRWKRD